MSPVSLVLRLNSLKHVSGTHFLASDKMYERGIASWMDSYFILRIFVVLKSCILVTLFEV